MSDIIVPGKHGIGTLGFTPVDSGYEKAAKEIVGLLREGRYVDESDPEVVRILNYKNCFSLDELKLKV